MAEEVQDTSRIGEALQTSLDIPEPSILLYIDRLRPPIGTSYFKRYAIRQPHDVLSLLMTIR